jgi:hypothetical protein
MIAAEQGQVGMIDLLLARKADLNATDRPHVRAQFVVFSRVSLIALTFETDTMTDACMILFGGVSYIPLRCGFALHTYGAKYICTAYTHALRMGVPLR